MILPVMQHTKKEKIGVSISPNLKREAEEIMQEEGIPTMSYWNTMASGKKKKRHPTCCRESVRAAIP